MTVAYIRTYSNNQKTESQKNTIEQFAKINGIVIDKWYRDTINSSKSRNKAEEIIKGLHDGDTLIVTDITRLSRKLMEIMHLILLCIEKKVNLQSLKEGYTFENNVDSKTLAFTFGLVSEIESKLISARTKEALNTSKNKGVKLGRPQGSAQTSYLMSQKNQIEKDLREANTTYAELAEYYNVSLSGFKRFVRENLSKRKK
jgi:DNA invertase Pin-like site-specific DNA recombinase